MTGAYPVRSMERHTLDTLTRFCAGQQEAFDRRAWLLHAAIDAKAIAVAAKYLSMTSWYGHEEDLERVAIELDSGVAMRDGFEREARAVGFDITHFSTAIRYEIGRRRMQRARPGAWEADPD